MSREVLRVANCSGFFGDRQSAALEMVESADFDVLTGDWLAELTMLILQRQRNRDPLKGYASTFIGQLEAILGTCIDRDIRIVSNAGGMNPDGCAAAVRDLAERLGLSVAVGTVAGDDLLDRAPAMAKDGSLSRLDGSQMEDVSTLLAANAYLGAWGITGCLTAGADVVVTGRVTDAALVVGPSAWAFDWSTDDWDYLAGAVVAGHIIECGAQATGGNYSFFQELGDMTRLGFPIAEIHPDGSSVITKPLGSNGAVTTETVISQLLYEVGAPSYLSPDVTAILDSVVVNQVGPNRVSITDVRGTAPPPHLKVSMAVEGGYRNDMTMVLTGMNAPQKAAVAEAALWDLVPGGKESFDHVEVELLGVPKEDPDTLGAAVTLLRVAVRGQDKNHVGRTFSSAVIQTGLSSYPGFYMTTPPGPASEYATFVPGLVQATAVEAVAWVEGKRIAVRQTPVQPVLPTTGRPEPVTDQDWGSTVRVPLGTLCGARSGDKGGIANIGIWVRDQAHYAWLLDQVTAALLAQLLPDGQRFRVDRFEFPNLCAVNFVVHGWLGDGVASSLRFDSQAKGLAEFIRARHLDVPVALVSRQEPGIPRASHAG